MSATDKQRAFLLSLLKKHKSHADMTKWWADLGSFWVTTEIAPGVVEGSFSEELPKALASKYIELLKGLEPDKSSAIDWKARVGTMWVDTTRDAVVWVRESKAGHPYGKVALPVDTKFNYEQGSLKDSLVPLDEQQYDRLLSINSAICPVCRKAASIEHRSDHADVLTGGVR